MPRALMGAVAAIAACAAVLAACGDDPSTTTVPSVSVATPSAAVSSEPPLTMQPGPASSTSPCPSARICTADQAIVAGLQAVFSYRGADTDPAASAAARAGDLLSPTYRASVDGTWALLAPVTGAQWAQWKAERATVTARADVLSDEHPPDTATSAARVATVTQTVRPGGQTLAPITVWVVAKPGGAAGWQLDTITTQ